MSRSSFTVSSKLLQKKWDERAYEQHKQKMQAMRSDLPSKKQHKTYSHLSLRLKKIQSEEDRQTTIDHQNQILLQKMTRIMKGRGTLDNWNEYEARSLNVQKRERQQEKISEENYAIARRLGDVRPLLRPRDWEDEYVRHAYYLDLWASSTKDYGPASPRTKSKMANNSLAETRSSRDSQDAYESDFEEDEESETSSKLPKIDSRTSSGQKEKSKSRKEQTSVTRLPDINKRKEKEAEIENDAKQLFKATKQLAKADQVILKTLIQKSYARRISTRDKFKDMYDLDLQSELVSVSAEYEPLAACLLTEREAGDADSVNTLIHDNDVAGLISMFCSRNTAAMKSINKAYQDKYDVTISEDIEQRILSDECQRLLLAILNGNKSKGEVDEDLANNDAFLLFDAGKGRFTDPDGKFLEIMNNLNFPQIKQTFRAFKSVSGGKDVTSVMTKDGCPEQYVTAVQTMSKCMNSGAAYNAEKIHSCIKSGQKKQLISILLERAEIDMADIRKAYKKKYGSELVDDILARSGRDVGPLIAHIAHKQGKGGGAKNNKDQGKSQSQPKTRSPVRLSQQRRAPIKRPEPKPSQKQDIDDSPLSPRHTKKQGQGQQPKGQSQQKTQEAKGQQKGQTPNDKDKKSDSQKQEQGQNAKGQQKGQTQNDKDQSQDKPDKKANQSKGPAKTQGQEKAPGQKKEEQKSPSRKENRTKDRRASEQSQKKEQKPQQEEEKKAEDQKSRGSPDKMEENGSAESPRESKDNSEQQKPEETSAKDSKPDQAEDAKSEDTSSQAESDAERIHSAVKGFGTDEKPLIDILTSRTNAERQEIRQKYKDKYDKDLLDVMRSELTGDFEELTLALLTPASDYDAYCVHEAVDGPGTREAALIGILTTRSNDELSMLRSAYKSRYDRDLTTALRGDTQGAFQEMLVELAGGGRETGDEVYASVAENDARRLYNADQQSADLSDDVFRNILCKKNSKQLNVTFDEYKKLAGHSIEEGIAKAVTDSSDAVEGYTRLVEALRDPIDFYARRLSDAMSGLGTNDSQLIRLIVSRSEIDLPQVKARYKALFGKSLEASIEAETRGDYKKMLLAVVRK